MTEAAETAQSTQVSEAMHVQPEGVRRGGAMAADDESSEGGGCCGCFGSSPSSSSSSSGRYAKVAQGDDSGGSLSAQESGTGEAVVLDSPGNVGIPSSYFLVGFGPALLGTPLSVYMVKTLDASPAQQNTIGILMTLPWTFKVVYGFISDAFPIWGMRRKPYFLIGWAINILSYSLLALLSPTPDGPLNAAEKERRILQLSALLLLGTFGSIMADVMTDTLIVERAKSEPKDSRGTFQSTCYSVRFMGSILGRCVVRAARGARVRVPRA